jgi:death on curing protein
VTRYLSLAEYVWLAEQVTGVESSVLMKASRLDLAHSALHARPQAARHPTAHRPAHQARP